MAGNGPGDAEVAYVYFKMEDSSKVGVVKVGVTPIAQPPLE